MQTCGLGSYLPHGGTWFLKGIQGHSEQIEGLEHSDPWGSKRSLGHVSSCLLGGGRGEGLKVES